MSQVTIKIEMSRGISQNDQHPEYGKMVYYAMQTTEDRHENPVKLVGCPLGRGLTEREAALDFAWRAARESRLPKLAVKVVVRKYTVEGLERAEALVGKRVHFRSWKPTVKDAHINADGNVEVYLRFRKVAYKGLSFGTRDAHGVGNGWYPLNDINQGEG